MTVNNKLKKNKVTNFEDLTRLRKIFKNKKIGLAHGVFDLFHYGHLLHLEKAKSMCDILIFQRLLINIFQKDQKDHFTVSIED